MGIYHFVQEALNFCKVDARIHSFHSYDEMRKLTPPPIEHLIVVSASTSGGMARDLKNDQGFSESRILTLIDKSDSDRSGKVLIALENIDKNIFSFEADNFETEIELVGEHFSSKSQATSSCNFGQTTHATKAYKNFSKEFWSRWA